MCNSSTLNAVMYELATATFPDLPQSPLSINQNWRYGHAWGIRLSTQREGLYSSGNYQQSILHLLYPQTGQSALYLASWQGHKEIVAELLKKGADVNQQKEVGKNDQQHIVCMLCKSTCTYVCIHRSLTSEETPMGGAPYKSTKEWGRGWHCFECFHI